MSEFSVTSLHWYRVGSHLFEAKVKPYIIHRLAQRIERVLSISESKICLNDNIYKVVWEANITCNRSLKGLNRTEPMDRHIRGSDISYWTTKLISRLWFKAIYCRSHSIVLFIKQIVGQFSTNSKAVFMQLCISSAQFCSSLKTFFFIILNSFFRLFRDQRRATKGLV